MRALANKLKPKNGFAYYVHLGLTTLLSLLVFVFVRIDFAQLAIGVILLSKWRMLAVRPRYWLTNLRYNAVDIMVGVSVVLFMVNTDSPGRQLLWAGVYAFWLLLVKPGSGVFMVSAQALIGQIAALMALFLAAGDAPLFMLVLAVGAICFLSARHFFTSFDEHYGQLYSWVWGYFGAALMWVLGHWLLYYDAILAQPALLLSVLGFGFAGLYYLSEVDRLSPLLKRQFIFIMVAIVFVVIVFSDWGDKTL